MQSVAVECRPKEIYYGPDLKSIHVFIYTFMGLQNLVLGTFKAFPINQYNEINCIFFKNVEKRRAQ